MNMKAMKDRLSPSLRRLLGVAAGALLLLALANQSLFAQQKTSAMVPPSCLTPLSAAESSSSAAEARTMLPVIPFSPHIPFLSLAPGVAPGLIGPLPGEQPPSPDDPKILYGYRGAYYNTAILDGRVLVLDKSVYVWPTSKWKVTGMLRNQTRCPVHIRSIYARLLGSEGELLGTATATVPIDNLRPGEPGPFVDEASLAATAVKSVEWRVESAPAPAPSREFEFEISQDALSLDESHYDLEGTIHNSSTTSVQEVRVVMAWLDDAGKVFYVDSAKFYSFSNSTQDVDTVGMSGGGAEHFRYTLKDSTLALRVADAPGLALWGVSK